jgi:hypothetical protein
MYQNRFGSGASLNNSLDLVCNSITLINPDNTETLFGGVGSTVGGGASVVIMNTTSLTLLNQTLTNVSNLNVSNNIYVTGNTILQGGTTIVSNLNVFQSSILRGNTTVISNLNISGNSSIIGNKTILSNLNVSGVATLNNVAVNSSDLINTNLSITTNQANILSSDTLSNIVLDSYYCSYTGATTTAGVSAGHIAYAIGTGNGHSNINIYYPGVYVLQCYVMLPNATSPAFGISFGGASFTRSTLTSGFIQVSITTPTLTTGVYPISLTYFDGISGPWYSYGWSIMTYDNYIAGSAIRNCINIGNTSSATYFYGNVTGLTSLAVGLGNVNNTSDLNKPISTATQAALNTISSNTNFNNTVFNNVTITASLNISGTSSHAGSTTLLSNLYVSGSTTLKANATFLSTLNISGATTIVSTLNVLGNTTINGNLIINGGTDTVGSSNSTINILGNTTIGSTNSTLIMQGASSHNSSLNVSGTAMFNNITALGTLNVLGTLYYANGMSGTYVNSNVGVNVNNNGYIASYSTNLTQLYLCDAQGNVSNSGNHTTSGSLYVSGVSIIQGAHTVGSNLNVVGTSVHLGASSMGSSLNVLGAANLNTIQTTGIVVAGGTLTALGNMAVNGTTLMQGQLTMQYPATIQGAWLVGGTTITSNLNISGNTVMTANLNVGGNFTVNGTQTIVGGTVTSTPQTMSSTLLVSGASTLMSTLNVVGQTQINNNNLIVSNGNIFAEGSSIQVWAGNLTTGSVFNADTSGNVWNYGNHTILSSLNVIGSTIQQGSYGCWAQAPIYGTSYASGTQITWGAMTTSNGVTHTANTASFKLSQAGTYSIGASLMNTVATGSAGGIAQLLMFTSPDNATWTQFGSGYAAGPFSQYTPLTGDNIVSVPANYYVLFTIYSTVGTVTFHSSGVISYMYLYRIG